MAQRSLAALDTTEPSEIPNVLNLTDWSSLETVSMGSYGRALFLTGDFAAARRWLEEALTTQGAWYSIWRVSVLGSLGLLEAWCGNLARADALAHEALALAQETGRIGHPSTADAYLAHALVALEQGRPEGASLSLHEARLRARSNRRTTLMWIGELQRAQSHLALGQPDQVLLTLKAAEGSIGTPQPPIVAERALALCARSLRLQGRPAAARRLLAEMMPERPAVAFERAAAALSLGDTAGGAKLAAPLLGSSREEPVSTLLSLLMAAWIASDEGADGEAGTTLRGAMELAERCGLVERVVDAGPTVVALIARFFGRSPLAVSIATRSAKVRGAPRGETLIDPLTTPRARVALAPPDPDEQCRAGRHLLCVRQHGEDACGAHLSKTRSDQPRRGGGESGSTRPALKRAVFGRPLRDGESLPPPPDGPPECRRTCVPVAGGSPEGWSGGS